MWTVGGGTTSTSVSGLEPFSQYMVRVEAVNSAGNTSSVEVSVSTAQASPSGLSVFRVEKMTTGTSVILRWDPPAKPYGVINIYRVYERDSDIAIYSGPGFVFEFVRLQPYTQYFVKQEVCNDAGCTRGSDQAFTTAEIAPTGQPTPAMGMVNATHVLLRWTKPVNPNGQITTYEVFRRSTQLRRRRQASEASSDGKVVYTTSATNQSTFEYMDSGLTPYTQYEYKIRASNSQGYTESQWQAVQTSQAPPAGVDAPVVMLLEGEVNAVNITWTPPSQPNGVLQSYSLRKNTSIPLSMPLDGPFWYRYDGLEAYTVYSFTLTVCSEEAAQPVSLPSSGPRRLHHILFLRPHLPL
ncbi:hypothetical protein C0Q70_07788 [Pomacea canaliculata]|uniref:Fibronectin type-III domain-containing protein n=1 Tax=Pomacea canaliculata TaxID=400727 RepID=A0A2T7PG07_POMCA|nr:hypothetical protein C0Q70_07788 [Pomacea canaliculata]